MKIVPNNEVMSSRTGGLINLDADEISATIGFEPNHNDDPKKVVNSWGFTVDGIDCAIWDYKGSHKFGHFSTYGPRHILLKLFGDSHVA